MEVNTLCLGIQFTSSSAYALNWVDRFNPVILNENIYKRNEDIQTRF